MTSEYVMFCLMIDLLHDIYSAIKIELSRESFNVSWTSVNQY